MSAKSPKNSDKWKIALKSLKDVIIKKNEILTIITFTDK